MRRKPLFPPPHDKTTGKKKANKGKQPKTVVTVNGDVVLRRRWWHSNHDGSEAPVDCFIDAEGRTVSPGVVEMACRLNNDSTSFDAAAGNLERLAMVSISYEQLRMLVLAEGQAVLRAQQANAVPPAFQATDCLVDSKKPDGITRVYMGVDGVMVPIIQDVEKEKRRKKTCEKRKRCGKKCRPLPKRKKGADHPYKEFKVGVFYDEQGDHWHECLSRGKRNTVGATMRREALRLNFAAADETIGLVDGASWIENQLQEQPWGLDRLGLDFYHLGENVHRCRRGVYGEKDSAGNAWADDLMHTFKHSGYTAAMDKLTEWRTTFRSSTKKEAADRLINYVVQRMDMISYPDFIAKGWQIGSGPTESRCKTSTFRLKDRGRRWDSRNAEAIAALTTLKDSDQWALYWTTLCGVAI